MINKISLNKVRLLLVIMCGLFLFIPNTVRAATSPIQMEHKTNVPVNKVWKIKFNKPIIEDKVIASVKVYSPLGELVVTKVSYDSVNNTIIVEPPAAGYKEGQTYSLQIYETITDLDSNPLKAAVTKSFTIAVTTSGPLINTANKKYIYMPKETTLDQMVVIQSKLAPVNVVKNYYLSPSNIVISEYLNTKNFVNHNYAVYQFLTLNYIEGIAAEELDSILVGKGILEGHGKIFLDACKKYDVNPAYIIAHSLLETGNGGSTLANGVLVGEVAGQVLEESKITYNMFGIGARDSDPLKLGSERAYTEGWFTPEAAIEGGIKFISTDYINNIICKQNTLYEMRWNPAIAANATYRHQYATDIAWAYKQSYKIKEMLDKFTNANLVFEIPQYK